MKMTPFLWFTVYKSAGVGHVIICSYRDLGSISQPCCMKAPSENQRLLKMVKLLVTDGPSVRSSMCHSNGLNRLTRNKTTLTPM